MFYALMLALLAVILMVSGIAFRKVISAYAAAGLWFLAGLQAYTVSGTPISGTWDIYYGLFFLCMGFTIVSGFEAFSLRPKKEAEEEMEDEDIEFEQNIREMKSDMDKVNRPMNKMRSAIRGKRRKREKARKISISGLS